MASPLFDEVFCRPGRLCGKTVLPPDSLTLVQPTDQQPATPVDRRPEVLAISVVIPARNASSTLALQLDALLTQREAPAFEIIVSDNGSTDDTARLVERYSRVHPKVRLIDSGGRLGVSAARNAGIRHALAPHIAICDADDVVAPTWIAAMHHGLGLHEMVTGPMEYDRLNPTWVADGRGRAQVDELLFIGGGPALPYALGANIGVRRAAHDGIDGFDEQLIGGGDDVDYAWRVQVAGGSLGWAPGARVHYRLRHDLRGSFRQMRAYSSAHFALYEKHSDIWPLPPYRIGARGMLRRFAPALLHCTSRSAVWVLARDMGWAAGRLPARGVRQ